METKPDNMISNLSTHLFWDVDRTALNLQDHKKFIIHRILEYGLLSDWIAIVGYYGKGQIINVALKLRSLDKRTLAFMAAYANIPKEEFKCYTTKPHVLAGSLPCKHNHTSINPSSQPKGTVRYNIRQQAVSEGVLWTRFP